MVTVIPRLVEPEELAASNAIESVYSSTTSVGGPALGGVLIAVLGIGGAFWLDAGTFAASLWSLWMLPALPPAHDADRPSVRSIVEGFRFVRSRKVLLGMFLTDSNAMVFGMPRALFPALANKFGAHLTFRHGESTGSIDLKQQIRPEPAKFPLEIGIEAMRAAASFNRAYWKLLLRMYGWGRTA